MNSLANLLFKFKFSIVKTSDFEKLALVEFGISLYLQLTPQAFDSELYFYSYSFEDL